MTAKFRNTVLTSAAAAALAIFAAPVAVQAQEATYAFNIPAQELGAALRAYAKATRLQVVFDGAVVRGKTGSAVVGQFTAGEGLDRLLANSGLVARRTASGVIYVETSAATPAQKTEGPATPATVSEVTVTGTSIRGLNPESSPLNVYSRSDIDRSGAQTTAQFLRQLPENFSNLDEDGSFGTGVQTAFDFTQSTAVNLHGVGIGSTLTLLDGHRLAPTGMQGNVVDVSMIPLSVVDRVEVLTDGASAIYGSDAVAGVVNFRLKHDYNGVTIEAHYGNTTDGGGANYGSSLALGHSWGSGSVLFGFENYRQDPVYADQRSFITLPAAQEGQEIIPAELQSSLFFSGRQSLTQQLELYGDVLWSKRDFNVFLPTASFLGVGAGYSTGTTGTVGARYTFANQWQADASFNTSSSDAYVKNNLILPSIQIAQISHTKSETESFDFIGSGPLFDAPGGRARGAIGGEYRWEAYDDITLGRVTKATPDGADMSRRVGAVFGELFVPIRSPEDQTPLARKLEFDLAARYDDYSDFGSSTNPKVGVLWSPAEGLNFRGTFATSYRAPPLSQNSAAGSRYIAEKLPNTAAPGGFTDTIVISGHGNSDLKPETSRSVTFGTDYQPVWAPTLKLTATYFDIDYRNRIATPPLQGSITGLFQQTNVLAPYITMSPSASQVQTIYADPNFSAGFPAIPASAIGAIFDDRPTNVAKSTTQGIDASADYGWKSALGDLHGGLAVTDLLKSEFQTGPGIPSVELLNTVFNPVGLRGRGSLTLVSGSLTAAFFVNYVNSYKNTGFTPARRIGSWTTLDANVGYIFGDAWTQWLRGTALSASVTNLLDTPPPHVAVPAGNSGFVGFDGANANPRGRFISFSIKRSW